MRRFAISILMLAAFFGLVSAQTSLEECRALARDNYPAVRLYGLIRATRNCSLSNASMMRLPSIRLEASSGLNNNPSSIDDLFSNTTDPQLYQYWVEDILHNTMHVLSPVPYSYKVQAEISQNIYDGGVSRLAGRYAQAEAEYHMAQTDSIMEQLFSRVDNVYFSILLLERRLQQNRSQQELLLASRNRASSLLATGSARPVELDVLDAACIESEQEAAALETSLQSFRTALSLLTGKDMSAEDLMVPSRPSQPSASQRMLVLERKSELLWLERDQVNVAVRPRFEFVGAAYYGYPNNNIFANFTSHRPRLNWHLGLRLSWNLSSLYTRRNKLDIVTNRQAQLDVEKDMARKDTDLQNSSIQFEIDRLEQCIEKDHELMRLRERIRKTAELSFSQGEITATELISRVNDEFQARLNADIHTIECLRESFRLRQ